jgi:YVTN family beta-propeller protein
MKRTILAAALLAGTALGGIGTALAGQAPSGTAAPDIPISSHDRVYTSDQFSNTVSVVDPSTNKFLGVIRLGEPSPANFSPLYKGQVLAKVRWRLGGSIPMPAQFGRSGMSPAP